MIEAVIFDMDGVILDSHHVWIKTNKTFFDKRNIEFDDNKELSRRLGKKMQESSAILKELYGLSESVDDIVKERLEILKELSDMELKLMPGFLELVDYLEINKIKMALATGSPKNFVDYVIKKFSLERFFDAVITGDDVIYGKPDPEIFIKAAERMKIKNENCVVVEDAVNGLEAANAAGMYSIAYPNGHHTKEEYEEGDEFVNDLREITIDRLHVLTKNDSTRKQLRKETRKWLHKIQKERKNFVTNRQDLLNNINAYVSDAHTFLEKKDYIRAFEAVVWAWAWLEILKEMKILDY